MKNIPELTWINKEYCVASERTNTAIRIEARAKTDMFISPDGSTPVLNAPIAIFDAVPPFLFSACIRADLSSTFDAGALYVYCSDAAWAKFAFEYSPQHIPTVVSVATCEYSDDVNHITAKKPGLFLRIAALCDHSFAFHYSEDGSHWQLARFFRLCADEPIRVGFSAQSPLGDGATASFSEIVFENRRLEDLRSGA